MCYFLYDIIECLGFDWVMFRIDYNVFYFFRLVWKVEWLVKLLVFFGVDLYF